MLGSENKSREAKYKYPPVCFRCGGRHLATNCRFVSEIYHSCGKQGYIARVCRSAPGKHSDRKNPEPSAGNKEVHQVAEEPAEVEYSLFPVQGSNSKPLQTTMLVEGHKLTTEIDTGAAVSIVSEDTVTVHPS